MNSLQFSCRGDDKKTKHKRKRDLNYAQLAQWRDPP